MIEYLNQLEEKIVRLTGLYASVRDEKHSLSRENAELRRRMEELENENRGIKEAQGQARERIEALIKKIEGLEG